MKRRADVLFWAQRIVGKQRAPSHDLLGVAPDAGIDAARDAFHKIARQVHPDLHRSALTADELELVTSAYARVAGAYHDFTREQMHTTKIATVRDDKASEAMTIPHAKRRANTPTSNAMTSKALVFYRKAELALRCGDLRGAVLQLKLAIALDPQSPLLRSALTEVETELAKNT